MRKPPTPPLPRLCEQCHTEFLQYRHKERPFRFCSHDCMHEYFKTHSQRQPGARVLLECIWCKKDYERIPSHVEGSKFCSKPCRHAYDRYERTPHNKGIGEYKPIIDRKGYRLIWSFEEWKYVREHRYIMEQSLGRKLSRAEVVHHINHVRDDNRLENLQLFPSHVAHMKEAHRWKLAQSKAEQLLKRFPQGDALVNVFEIANASGWEIKIVNLPDHARDVAGFSKDTTIYVNAKDAPNRQTFTVAHEIGHIVLGHTRDQHGILKRDGTYPAGKPVPEKEADCFAANLLMPKDAIYREYKRTKDIPGQVKLLSDIFGVSADAMTSRLSFLHLI